MKKYIPIFTLVLSTVFTAAADDISLGYCDGGIVQENLSGVSRVAINLPADDFRMYAGSSIIGVRIGLDSDAAKGVDIFIRSGLDEENILNCNSGTLYRGWNDIIFDSPTEFPVSDVTVGYEVPSGVVPGLSSVAGLKCPGSCWTDDGTGWKDLSGRDGVPLCIQLLIDGESYSVSDAALLAADNLTTEAGAPFTIMGLIRNNTNRILTSAHLSCDWGEGIAEGDAVVEEVLPGEIGLFHLPVEGIGATGAYEALLDVVSVGGTPDEYSFNNTAGCRLEIVDEYVVRKVLLEEFTGQNCPNCPAGQGRIQNAIKNMDNVVLVAHHIGFGTDQMTASGSDRLLWFYNSNTSYAPAMMIDREAYSATPGPIGNVIESKQIRSFLEERSRKPAQVSLLLKRDYDPESRQLSIQASLKQVAGMEIGDNPVLHLLLVEDGIIAFQRPDYQYYEHNEANRMFVTAPLGDPVTLGSEERTVLDYNVTLDASWVADNMHIVAFVTNYDADDCNNCRVYNAEQCLLVGHDNIDDSSVASCGADEVVPVAVYNISGMRISRPARGVSIVRYSDGSTRKVMRTTD